MKTLIKDENLLADRQLHDFNYQIGIFGNDDFQHIEKNELGLRFNGIYRLLDFLDDVKDFGNRKPRSVDESYGTRSSSSWTQFPTYKQAVEKMRKNPEVFRNFTERDIRLRDDDSVGNYITFEKSGDYIDIGRYLEGDPDCFGVMQGGRFERKFCSIVVNISASCAISRETIQEKAKRTLRLVDWLEMNGVRCEVGILSTTEQVHLECIVKNYRDPLDINELAVALSTDFFRWVVFRLTEHSKLRSASYGRPCDSDASHWTDENADNTIYVDSLSGSDSKERVNESFNRLEKKILDDNLENGKSYNVIF